MASSFQCQTPGAGIDGRWTLYVEHYSDYCRMVHAYSNAKRTCFQGWVLAPAWLQGALATINQFFQTRLYFLPRVRQLQVRVFKRSDGRKVWENVMKECRRRLVRAEGQVLQCSLVPKAPQRAWRYKVEFEMSHTQPRPGE